MKTPPSIKRPVFDGAALIRLEGGIYKVMLGERQLGTLFRLPSATHYRFVNDFFISQLLNKSANKSLAKLQSGMFKWER